MVEYFLWKALGFRFSTAKRKVIFILCVLT